MNATYGQAQAVAVPNLIDSAWSLLDLLAIVTLVVYIAANLLPQEMGSCAQNFSANASISQATSV